MNSEDKKINFYSSGGDYGCFSNFSSHKVRMDGRLWKTSEHYFQSQKFVGVKGGEKHIRDVFKAKSPMEAARIGRDRKRSLRRDWESVKDRVMYSVVYAKFAQHEDLKKILLDTGDAILMEHTEKDSYWGDGGDGSGKNMLGQTLMRVRKELKDDE